MTSRRPRYWQIGGRKVVVYWTALMSCWVAQYHEGGQHITYVESSGSSQFTSSAYPAKKFGSIKNAIEYVLLKRGES